MERSIKMQSEVSQRAPQRDDIFPSVSFGFCMIVKVKAKSYGKRWDSDFNLFSVLLGPTLSCFCLCVCQAWAVLMMDVQGCHLQIASVKMIDPSLLKGRLKFTALELNLRCAFPSSQALCCRKWTQFDWRLVKSHPGTGNDPAGVLGRTVTAVV